MCDEFDTSCVAAANDTERRASYGVVMTTNTKGGVMKVKGSRRLVARLGLALAVAAIAAPGAQAVTMNATFESGGGARLYADDLHAPLAVSALKASNIRTDGASSVPLTDARHSALLKHRAQIGQTSTQLASTQLPSTDSPSINWGVAAIGAALGAFGLMLLFAVVVYAGRHNRRGRLAAT
jgi:hypothetical protein